jgi:hypothetical protein
MIMTMMGKMMMMNRMRLLTSLLLLVSLTSSEGSLWSKALGCFKCPTATDHEYPKECLANAIPPWPICLFHSVDYFVDKSLDAASRCCGDDDISECKCPKKDTPEFLNKIGEWCHGVQTCHQKGGGEDYEPSNKSHIDVEETTTTTTVTTDVTNKIPKDHVYDDPTTTTTRQLLAQEQQETCPADDSYDPKCLQSAIPPYPICTRKTVDEWVRHALQGYDDCCGKSLEACTCPKKDSDKFGAKIGDWCAGVKTCDVTGANARSSSSSSEGIEIITTSLRASSTERLQEVGNDN